MRESKTEVEFEWMVPMVRGDKIGWKSKFEDGLGEG